MIATEAEWAAYRRAVGDRLRTARLQANHTQESLAERAGVSRDTVQRVERGDGDVPRLAALWRLARAVGVPVSDLLADTGGDTGDRRVP